MDLIKRFKIALKRRKLKQQAMDKMGEEIYTPFGYLKKCKEIDCTINGHQWISDFDPKSELDKPIEKRVYCKHCGVYYHEHKYHEQ